jgi:hypothetical protein
MMESNGETLIEKCDSAITNYTNLNLEFTGVYNLWSEFIKPCHLLETRSDLKNQATGFTEN